MKQLAAALAILTLALSGCSRAPESSNATAPAAAAPAAAPASPAATTPPALTAGEAPVAAPPSKPAAPVEESKLERVAALPAAGQLPSGKWVAGTNYRPLVPAQPTDAPPGKIEVVEVFWYGCPHCYALDPYIESWRKTKPAYVEFKRVPVTWQAVHQSHAKLFYALEALGKEEALHSAVFSEMHDKKNFMFMQGNEKETLAAQVAFVKAHGISESDYTNAYNSFTVQTDMSKADDLVHRYHVDGVPLLVVNGKYVVDVNMAGSQANVMSIVNDLIASEKSH
jgi:thiol:disulfide interchange protein DsbA